MHRTQCMCLTSIPRHYSVLYQPIWADYNSFEREWKELQNASSLASLAGPGTNCSLQKWKKVNLFWQMDDPADLWCREGNFEEGNIFPFFMLLKGAFLHWSTSKTLQFLPELILIKFSHVSKCIVQNSSLQWRVLHVSSNIGSEDQDPHICWVVWRPISGDARRGHEVLWLYCDWSPMLIPWRK